MIKPIIYELIIREVFSCERFGDPARLANTDVYQDSCLGSVKVALNYALEFIETKERDELSQQVSIFRQRINNAGSVEDLDDLLTPLLDCVRAAKS